MFFDKMHIAFEVIRSFFEKIKFKWIDVAIVIVAITAIWFSYLLCNIDYSNFCGGFLGNLLSDSIVAILFGFFFVRYYESRNIAHPTLVANGEKQLVISKNPAKTDGFVLHFGVLNENRKALQQGDGFYHIFINKELSPEKRRGTTGREMLENNVQGLENYVELHDMNPGPCLFNSILTMVDVACKLHSDVNESTIYYFFNTENGVFPKSAKFGKDISEDIKTYGKLKIKFV